MQMVLRLLRQKLFVIFLHWWKGGLSISFFRTMMMNCFCKFAARWETLRFISNRDLFRYSHHRKYPTSCKQALNLRRSWVQTEAVVQRCSVKKVFLEISINSQENTCARVSFLIKLQAWGLKHSCFPVNFVKFLRTPFSIEHFWWLLLFRICWMQLYSSSVTTPSCHEILSVLYKY